jgi:hypothetical protein
MAKKTKIPRAFATEHTEATEILVAKDKEQTLTTGEGYSIFER